MSVNVKDNDKVLIEVKNLEKSFGDHKVLRGISTQIRKGEVVAIIGPSGCGKSTFLRSLNLLEVPTNGQVIFEGTDITDKTVDIDKTRQRIGMVFQQFNLFPHKSVLENIIEAPTRALGEKKESAINKANEILSFLGLSDKANNYPCELSGGQKQRVAIGRALALNPKLMCFDEPTSALDPSLTLDVAKLIKSLSKTGMSMLIITHDMEFAKLVSDKIVSMDSGKIIEKHIYNKCEII